ncbi:MAG: energy transducer TonB [Sphingomonadaceae bacterium]|nr:energy transducer TonB [Sphingomonadaceae bacterium]
MAASGYLQQKPRSPGALAIVLALHAGVLTAVFLAHEELGPRINGSFPRRDYPPARIVDPPPIPQPLPHPRGARERIDKPLTPSAGSEDTTTATFPLQGGGSGAATSDGEGTIVEPPFVPPAAPVIAEPRLDPRFARDVQPPYPPTMQRQEVEGSVTVRVLVGADGRVLRIEAVSIDRDAFLNATRDWALRHWRFTPGTRDGVPVEAWRTMTVRFRLER